MSTATIFPTIAIKVKPTDDGGFVFEVGPTPTPKMTKEIEMPRQRMIGAPRKKQQLCFD
jgi:hypothetical protein